MFMGGSRNCDRKCYVILMKMLPRTLKFEVDIEALPESVCRRYVILPVRYVMGPCWSRALLS